LCIDLMITMDLRGDRINVEATGSFDNYDACVITAILNIG
jgi:hypothetical protein